MSKPRYFLAPLTGPTKLLTRVQAAAKLGISLATLRRREGKQITPVMTALGEHLFRECDVLALCADNIKRRGAARARRAIAIEVVARKFGATIAEVTQLVDPPRALSPRERGRRHRMRRAFAEAMKGIR